MVEQNGGDYVGTATALIKSVAPGITFRLVDDHYIGANGIAHVYFKQTANGVDIDNAAFNVNVSLWHLSLRRLLTEVYKD